MEVSLAAKTILITGGTSVLGQAFVRKALENGAHVFFTFYTNESKANELELAGAKAFRANLANTSDIIKLKTWISSEISHLDGLIHNSAIVKDRTIQNLTESEWDEILQVDLKSVYFLTKELLRLLLKKERSKILTIISRVGLRGGFGQANYAAAKGGLIALTKSLAKELGKRKILVNGLNPGFLKSKMTAELPKEVFQMNQQSSVLSEISDPDEVADFMVYLMSDRVKHASGQIFHYESRST